MGLMELAVIAIVGAVVLGPDRLPEFARQATGMLRGVRRVARQARDDLREQLGPEYGDLELRDLDPRALVRRHLAEVLSEDDEPDSLASAREPALAFAAGATPAYDTEAT